jgi:hypothetical protein
MRVGNITGSVCADSVTLPKSVPIKEYVVFWQQVGTERFVRFVGLKDPDEPVQSHENESLCRSK